MLAVLRSSRKVRTLCSGVPSTFLNVPSKLPSYTRAKHTSAAVPQSKASFAPRKTRRSHQPNTFKVVQNKPAASPQPISEEGPRVPILLNPSDHYSKILTLSPSADTTLLFHGQFDMKKVLASGILQTKYLSALRRCHQFDKAISFLTAEVVDQLSPSALIEAGRLLLDARSHAHSYGQEVARLLRQRSSQMRLPPSLSATIDFSLNSLLDEKTAVKQFSPEKMEPILWKRDAMTSLACSALRTNQFDMFRQIVSVGNVPVHCPTVAFWLIDRSVKKKINGSTVAKWYASHVGGLRECIADYDYENITKRVFRACQYELEKVDVTRDGCIGTQGVQLPPAPPLTKKSLELLRNDMLTLLQDLSKLGGSISPAELTALQVLVREWRQSADPKSTKAVVIDSLNLTYRKPSGLLEAVVNEILLPEYKNVMIISRNFLRPYVSKIQWKGNVCVYYSPAVSEDDLHVLMAALDWGQGAYVLSNDRFGAHAVKMKNSGTLSLENWLQQRQIHYERSSSSRGEVVVETLPNFDRRVTLLEDGSVFLPVIHPESSFRTNPSYSYHLATPIKKKSKTK